MSLNGYAGGGTFHTSDPLKLKGHPRDKMASRTTFQPVILNGLGEASLVFLDGALVAVVSKLDSSQEDLEGRWFPEAVFDAPFEMNRLTFGDLEEIASYLQEMRPLGKTT